jgi:hypothetical protein
MKKIILFAVVIIFTSSCGSGIYKNTDLHLDKEGVFVESYSLDEFDIYTYSICEDATKETNNKRFSNCQENFYDLAQKDTLLKVEEVYLLRNRYSNVIIYLTTLSVKYIKYKKGFLNDRSVYENKIILDNVEYAYIGEINTNLDWIHFPNQNDDQDIILHFDKVSFPKSINLIEANIATAENKYNTDEKINLGKVFRQPIIYRKKKYKVQFFKGKIGKKPFYLPKCINIISRQGKIELVFGCKNDSYFFKISNRKVKYNTNFYLLKEKKTIL